MVILSELGGTIQLVADQTADVLGFAEIVDADPFVITIDVDARAAVAAAQRYQRLGVRLRKDRGDGVMVTIGENLIARNLTITEDSDQYGDLLTFQLIGERWSPFARAELRQRAKVEVQFKYGANPLTEFDALVFTGYIVRAPFDVMPPSSTVECMDAAALHARKTLKTYYLPPNSGRTWLSIIMEMCVLADIPVGRFDLGGSGGIPTKPVAPGAQPLLDFFRDVLATRGVEIGFEGPNLCAYRYDPDAPPVIELTPNNLLGPPTAGVSAVAPDTLAANVTGVVSVAYTRTDATGTRTEETRVITTGPYAPMAAAGPWPTETRMISELITRTSYLGSLDIEMDQEEYGWYARLAASVAIQFDADPPGYEIVVISPVNYYTYPDGSTRADSAEKFTLVRKTNRKKTVNSDRYVTRIEERRHKYQLVRKAIWQVTGGDDVLETPTQVPLSDDGQGLMHPRELNGLEGGSALLSRPTEFAETDFTLNADGTIFEEKTTEHFYDMGQPRRRADGAHGYGVESITYAALSAESDPPSGNDWGGRRTTTKRYRAITEDTYEVTETIKDGLRAPTVRTSRLIGALPRAERAEAESSSQEIRAEIKDQQRIAFAGGEEIPETVHNEFVDTPEQARTYALFLARHASAIRLDCSVGVEALAHKHRLARVKIPGASIDGLTFEIRSVSRDAATFREGIAAAHYPALA